MSIIKKRQITIRSRRALSGYLFIAPFLFGFLVFMVRPMIQSMIMSFHNVTLSAQTGITHTPVGWGNYLYAFTIDPEFNQLLVDEIVRMVTHSLATMVLAFMIALLLNQRFKGRGLARAIFFLPVILSSGVLVGIETNNSLIIGMKELIAESNNMNFGTTLFNLLSTTGIGTQTLDVVYDLLSSVYDIVMASGIQIVIFLSGLQTIPRSMYEAAEMEGTSAWESFWMVTFPIISPLLIVNMIYTIIDFFMKTDNLIMEKIHEEMFINLKYGYSSALSWIYFAVAIALIGISWFIIHMGVKRYD
ncbi:MAG TPA: sugar ABC transporter permease [Clostridia bacterium]|jgi:ABC-type sugar transport system permease subunit|nr:sugar ABC transporter permease [Clostridia bacterium]HPY43000.1 sugar ABC transporter permease [Clostridia bacterium]HQA98345.1 sugar ABC transporter permease [Clostridia bacterium]HQO55800.1 sugar ABC transporter permease [Clostridia bacterium]